MLAHNEGTETRTWEQLRKHDEIEKALSNKLRYASKEECCRLYASLYAELYHRVPSRPQLRKKLSEFIAK